MDDSVLAKFQSTLGEFHASAKPLHYHSALYKSRGEGYASQESRRKLFLQEQQNRRRNYADHARRIAEGGDISEEEGDGEMEEGGFDEVDIPEATPEVKKKQPVKPTAGNHKLIL